MSNANSNSRQGCYKSNPISSQSSRTHRHQVANELRKSKREDQKLRCRNIDLEDPTGQSAGQLSVNEIVGDEERPFHAKQSARKMLNRKRDPPFDMIGHDVGPICVRFGQELAPQNGTHNVNQPKSPEDGHKF